tara:strand:+ start:272 stop:2890 length:2619 start_codon:yes stop_codon:yes gene_type:complete
MKTAAEYLKLKLPIIPCGAWVPNKETKQLEYKPKAPRVKAWQKTDFKEDDFKPEDNIGLKLKNLSDVDIDNPRCLPFIERYIKPCGAKFGREKQQPGHHLFKGKSIHRKFVMPDAFESYFIDNPHGATLIECRSGEDKQTIVPGSFVDGTKENEGVEIVWNDFEDIAPYNGDLLADVTKVAFATACAILFPKRGSRADYTYAIASILARYTQWEDADIDNLVFDIAELAAPITKDNPRKLGCHTGLGTHARKQMEQEDGKLFGFPKLKEILNLDDFKGLYAIFAWVGVRPPNVMLQKLKTKNVYVVDSSSMYDVETHVEFKKDDFNNRHLFYFPGGEKKDLAFQSLMKDAEFQLRIVQGRAALPGYEYPIATIDKGHFYLKPGRYLNLYPGPPIDPVKGDCSDWIDSYKLIFGDANYEIIEQYYAAVIQKMFHFLKKDLTDAERKIIGPLKIQWGLLIVGPEGTGKKGIAMSLQRIIGRDFVDANARYDEMINSHTETILNKLFIFINEVVATGKTDKKLEISNKLKPFWTDEDCKINPKHIRPYRYWNNCNGTALSNEKDCLYISKSSRRYCVIDQYVNLTVPIIEKFEKDGVFKKIYSVIDTDKIQHLFHHLLYEVKIKDWSVYNSGRAPKTDALLEMQDDAQHPTIKRLDRALKTRSAPFNNKFPGFCTMDQIIDFIKGVWKLDVNEKWIKTWLSEVHFKWNNGKETRQGMCPDGSRPRYHLLEDSDFLRGLTEGELGTAPDISVEVFVERVMQGSLKNMEHKSWQAQEDYKIKMIRDTLKMHFGPKWNDYQYEKFLERILLKIYRARKTYKEIVEQSTSGSDGSVDMQLVLKRKIAAETAAGIKKENQDYFNTIIPDADLWEEEKDMF